MVNTAKGVILKDSYLSNRRRISQDDRDIIKGYRDRVFMLKSIRDQIQWNQRRGLPVLDLPAKAEQLLQDLSRFELAMDRIQDRRARNAIRCRFALGWSSWDIALAMGLNRNTVNRIILEQLRLLACTVILISMSV